MDRIKSLFSSRYVLNLGWLGGAELVQRFARLATTVVLARNFSAADYGMVSAIYSIFAFANVISVRGGIAAKIIQSNDEDLEDVCNTAFFLNWILMGSLFLVQCALSYPIAQFYNDTKLVFPICAVGLVYLILPTFMVRSSLLERQNLLKVRAWSKSAQSIVANVIIVILALRGFGVWAIVFAMVVGHLVWIPIIGRFSDWKPKPGRPTFRQWRPILSFGGKRLGVDLLNRLRQEMDYLIVARFLGLEALGIYFFAYSAGIGISQSVINSFGVAWYPYLCEVRRDPQALRSRFLKSLKTIAFTILPLVIVQSCLAPFYVPIVFGEKWEDAIPILILICLSAVPIALEKALSALLQATDKMAIDIRWNIFFSIAFAGILVVSARQGVLQLAIAVLVSRWIFIPGFAFYVMRYLFPRPYQTSQP